MKVKLKPGVSFLSGYKPIQLYNHTTDSDPTDLTSGASKLWSNGLTSIEEDDIFEEKGSNKDRKKMKLFSSKRKSSLFIPGLSFRKKLSRNHKGRELSEIGPLSEDSLLVRPCDGDTASIKSSVSSLEEQLSDQRTDSVDSGIDCLHPAFLSGANLSCGNRQQTVASPLLSTTSLPSPSTSKLVSDLPSDPNMQKRFSQNSVIYHSRGNTGQSSKGKGRAPIASPEDDSLLDNPEQDSDSDSDSDSDLRSPPRKSASVKSSDSAHNTSASSFHTLSDCSSCDYDTDSDSYSSCSSDGQNCRFGRSTESDSDSDSDTSQCSAYYVPPKCYMDTSLSRNASSAGQPGRIAVSRGSKLPSNSVHTNCVNTSQTKAKQSDYKKCKSRIEKAPLSFLRKRKNKKSSKASENAEKSLNKSHKNEKSFNSSQAEDKIFNTSQSKDRTCNRTESFNSSRTKHKTVKRSESCDQFDRSYIFNTSQPEGISVHNKSQSLKGTRQPVKSLSQDKINRNQSRDSRTSLKTDGRFVKSSKSSLVMENPHVLVNPSPKYISNQTDHSIMVTPVRESLSTSNLTVNSRSAFSRWNTTGSLPRQRISYVDGEECRFTTEEPIYHEIDDIDVRNGAAGHYINVRDTNNSHMSSFGYVQMCAVKNTVSANVGQTVRDCDDKCFVPNESSEKSDMIDNSVKNCDKNSQLPLNRCDYDQDTSAELEASPNLPMSLDTSKSIVDVRRAMKKTAFWVENATYDSTCGSEDGSPSSLLKDKKSVSEMDLCNQIIDIYFGEDSDSSLSSSCLENSFDQDSSLSFGTDENASPDEFSMVLPGDRKVETSADDYSLATFVSEPYHTSEAKTRKIRNADNELGVTHSDEKTRKPDTLKTKQHHQFDKQPKEKAVLKEKFENMNTPKKSEKTKTTRTTSVSRVFCDNRPPSLLSEHEVDTITKLHTICNSQRKVSYLDVSKAEMIIKHYPPPKHASRISWSDQLANADLNHHTPTSSPAKRSILHQRPQSFIFPYVEDEPSPIVITRLRRSKSSSRRKEWPW
ncbi:uncharacterized protein LOC132565234 [Ylistrum balloti]|uniref:uncharacterized protein LOC132565234 n=1 Tax=Ylistrum balloti TaxID=509963 RepID=UPI0029058579|nr:uncharacterized protein LOC132565234 [Ylistrum balloti]